MLLAGSKLLPVIGSAAQLCYAPGPSLVPAIAIETFSAPHLRLPAVLAATCALRRRFRYTGRSANPRRFVSSPQAVIFHRVARTTPARERRSPPGGSSHLAARPFLEARRRSPPASSAKLPAAWRPQSAAAADEYPPRTV